MSRFLAASLLLVIPLVAWAATDGSDEGFFLASGAGALAGGGLSEILRYLRGRDEEARRAALDARLDRLAERVTRTEERVSSAAELVKSAADKIDTLARGRLDV